MSEPEDGLIAHMLAAADRADTLPHVATLLRGGAETIINQAATIETNVRAIRVGAALAKQLSTAIATNGKLIAAMRLMLTDFRTEGCADPDCGVCKRSKAAEKAAREALNA